MDWLNSNSAAITAIATVLLTFITGYYAFITLGLLRENREIRAAMNQPDLAIYATAHEGYINFLNLVVENVGPGAAYDVKLSTDQEFKTDSDLDLRRLGLFRHTLGFFASGQKIEHFLTSMVESWDELMSRPLEFQATYRDNKGKLYEKKFSINFAVFESLRRIGKQPLYSLADDLEKIQKDIHNITTGFSKVQVLTEPLEQYRGRQRAEHLYYLARQLPEERQRELTETLQSELRQTRVQSNSQEAHNPGPQADG